jgi:hypothetical protein
MADWTMVVLAKAAEPAGVALHARFWRAYGIPVQTRDAAFRNAVYEAMHIGGALAWAHRHDDDDTIERGTRELRAVVQTLPGLCQ